MDSKQNEKLTKFLLYSSLSKIQMVIYLYDYGISGHIGEAFP